MAVLSIGRVPGRHEVPARGLANREGFRRGLAGLGNVWAPGVVSLRVFAFAPMVAPSDFYFRLRREHLPSQAA